MKKIPHDPNEILPIVNENDKVIGKEIRKIVHEKGLLHRQSNVYFLNSKKELLLQKRTDQPVWDHAAAGHVLYLDDYETTAKREAFEELGIKISKKELIEIAKEKLCSKNRPDNRIAKTFLIKKDIFIEDFKIDKEEVSEVKYFNKKELEKLLKTENITPSTKQTVKRYLLQLM